MDHEGTNKKPYKGVWLLVFLMYAFPTLLFAIFFALQNKYAAEGYIKDAVGFALFVGFAHAFLLDIGMMIGGMFSASIVVVGRRIAEFFSTVTISFKLAVKEYFLSIKEDGIVFWIYLFVIASHIFIAIYGALLYFE